MADLSKNDLDEFQNILMANLKSVMNGNDTDTGVKYYEEDDEYSEEDEEYSEEAEEYSEYEDDYEDDILNNPDNFGGLKYNPAYQTYEEIEETPVEEPLVAPLTVEDLKSDISDSVSGIMDKSSIVDENGNDLLSNNVGNTAPVNSNIVSKPPVNYNVESTSGIILSDDVRLTRPGVDVTYSPVIVFLYNQGKDMGYPVVLSSESGETNDVVFGSDKGYVTGYVGVLVRQASSNHPMSLSIDGKEESTSAGVTYKMNWFPEYKGAKVVSSFMGVRYRTGDALEFDSSYKCKKQGVDFWNGTSSSTDMAENIEDLIVSPTPEDNYYSDMIQRQADEIINLKKQIEDLTKYNNMEQNVGVQCADEFNSTSAFNRYNNDVDEFYKNGEMPINIQKWNDYFNENKTPQEYVKQPEPVIETYEESMNSTPLNVGGTEEDYLSSLAEFRNRLVDDIIFKFGGLENIHSFCVEGDHTLKINNVSYKPRLNESTILTFPLDVRRACRNGAFACIFDYSCIAKMTSLRTLEFPCETFLRNYVAPNLGFKGNFRPDYLFDISPSIQEIIYGNVTINKYDRDKYIDAYNEQYGNKVARMNEICNNFVFENFTKGGIQRIRDVWSQKNWGFFTKLGYCSINLVGSAVGATVNVADTVGKSGIRKAGNLFRKAFTSTKL